MLHPASEVVPMMKRAKDTIMIASFYFLKSPMKNSFGSVLQRVRYVVVAVVCLANTIVSYV